MKEENNDSRRKRRIPFVFYMLIAAAAMGVGGTIVDAVTGVGLANYITGWNNSTDVKVVNATFNSSEANFLVTLKNSGSPVCTPANGLCNGSGTVTSVNASKESSAVINITPAAVTTSGTLLFQFPDATSLQSGFMTATQATSLALKALGSSCTGYNSTHINVTMNSTTAGVQCVEVLKSVSGNFTSQEVRALSYYGSSTTPSVVVGDGSGGGSGNVVGNNAFGLVNVTTAGIPLGGGNVANVTFSTAYTSKPYCVLNPANSVSAGLSGVTMVRIDYQTSTTVKFVITAGGTGLATATTYSWVYHCGG